MLKTDPLNEIAHTKNNITVSNISKSTKPKSEHAKRRLVTTVANDIAEAVSLLNETEFKQMLNLLKA